LKFRRAALDVGLARLVASGNRHAVTSARLLFGFNIVWASSHHFALNLQPMRTKRVHLPWLSIFRRLNQSDNEILIMQTKDARESNLKCSSTTYNN
jgi:hypothetical protein